MKQFVKIFLLTVISLILIAGCSKKEKVDTASESQNEPPTSQNSKEENSQDTKEKENIKEEKPEEDQLGLKLGETGVVESEEKIEVTLDSPRFENEVAGITPSNDVFMVVNATVKNIGDSTFDGKDIFVSDISTDENNERSANLNPIFEGKDTEVKLLSGELKPGDTVKGELVFDTKKAKKYQIAFGHESSQIITKSAWNFSENEVK